MAIRDLLNNRGYSNQNAYDEQRENKREGYLHRFVGQLLIASLLFAGVVYCYDQDGKVGESVRFVVAMATAEDEDLLAVSGEIFPDMVAPSQGGSVDVNVPPKESGIKDEQGRLVMILPTSGLMERGFGEVSEDGAVSYDGIDIRCQYEQQVKASAAGTVATVEAGKEGENKTTVIIKHSDQLESQYIGLDKANVAVGDTIRQGEVIGNIKEGVLHFAVYENGLPVDPFLFLNGPSAQS